MLNFGLFLIKIGGPSPKEIKEIREMIAGPFVTYNRYFFEDAIRALKTGKPFKSAQRENYEKYLRNSGIMAEVRIKENEDLMARIASKKPISQQGSTVLVRHPPQSGWLDEWGCLKGSRPIS